MKDIIGQSLGRYHILERLGEGGMATVYKAYDTKLERNVAVKVIRSDQFGSAQLESMLKRFEREAKSLAKLSHPNILKVLDYGEHQGAPYIVMEYLPGGTLKERIGKPVPWRDAARVILPIAEALEYAHENNIIHRDIKPSNILLTEKGQPMLTDFGIAKILEAGEGATLTGPGMGIGTPEYMAPEQWTGKAAKPSDVYSLGVVLYEMVTGHKPYTADTPAAIFVKQVNDPLPRPKSFIPDLPDEVEQILLKALAKNPEDRFLTSQAFLEKLYQVMGVARDHRAAPLPPVVTLGRAQTSGPARSQAQKSILIIGTVIAGAAFFLCLLIGGGIVFQSQTERNATRTAATATNAGQSAAQTEAAGALATTGQAVDQLASGVETRAISVFGPASGELAHSTSNTTIASQDAGIDLQDFVVEAVFTNPYSASVGNWDYGFLFRDLGSSDQYMLILFSSGEWRLLNREGDSKTTVLKKGSAPNFSTGANDRNRVKLICLGEKGFLYINDTFAAQLDLSARTNSGDISVATGIYSGDEVDGYATAYEDFAIWAIP